MSELNEEQWQQIEAALYAGRKIEAIKLYRTFIGCDLKSAKDAVETHEAGLRQDSPEKFTAPAKSGCAAVLFLAVLAVTFVAMLTRA